MKLFNLIACFLFLTFVTNKSIQSQDKMEKEILSVSVNGLVCDFCARSIEKLFNKKESVENINVDLEKMLITIYLKKGEILNDDMIKQIITDSGYDVREINREKIIF
mgnify:CR=1 FL=1